INGARVTIPAIGKLVQKRSNGAVGVSDGGTGATHNITLFHYRNHGAAEGRVLVGLQATDAKQNPDGLIETLEQINYPYAEITDNVGYKRFLK
ncbi:MAG: hypothetical protein E6588_19085, partial [Acinetobacter sp.]|nr:hypothetical protein [Acinetobacter sp.]